MVRIPALIFAMAWASSLFAASVAGPQFSEPAWCNPATFGHQIIEAVPDQRIFVFKIGRLTLAGMPVGNMDPEEPLYVAHAFSRANARDNYCTWYVNSGNVTAEAAFVHRHLPAPASIVSLGLRESYLKVLDESFGSGAHSFLNCAEKRNYIAIGCNQMRHRGPTAFAMLLAFSGCTADHATQIVNNYWGLNFIPYWVRSGIVQGAADLGNARPAVRARLQRLMR